MSKRARQYIGILAAVVVYYLVHEGAHERSTAWRILPCWCCGNVLRRICFGRTCGQNMLRKEQTASRNALLYNDCIFTA